MWANGDFEADPIGSVPSGWTVAANLNPAITDLRPGAQTLASLNLGSGGTEMTFVVGGPTESLTDPDIGASGTLRFPKYGQRAARVNYLNTATPGKNKNSNTLRQQMKVGLGDVDIADGKVHVRFAIAPVLENPDHVYTQQPYYFVRLHNLTTNTTIYQDFNASGQPGVPWRNFTTLSGTAGQYTDWQLVDIAPGDGVLSVGDQVELLITAAGCSASGHWGRVYVDAVGSGVPGLFAWATGPQSANAGSDVTYTINYKNGGTTTTTGTTLDFVTPPNTTFQAVSLGGACTTPAIGATGTVSCPLGTLANGAVDAFTVRVKINAGTANGTVITNGNYSIYATGSSALVGPKVNTTVTSSVTYADVAVTGGDGLAAIAWGAPTSYTFAVTNAGPANASTVNVTDTIPAQLASATWTCSATGGGSCPASGSGNISHAISLPAGAVATYVVQGNIIAGTGNGTIRHTMSAAVAGGVSDPDTNNNSAVDNTAIGVPRTVTVTKSGGAALGSILSTPASLSCGTACASTSASFLEGTQVMLTASPAPGATFIGWTGACSGTTTSCTLTVSGDMSVGATFVGAPASTSSGGSGQTTAVSTAFPQPLEVTVVDDTGAPVPNITVTYSVPGSGASATRSSATAITNAAGTASITVTANATPGAYHVTATVPGIAEPIVFALANVGAPASIAVSDGGTQSATVGASFASPLEIIVRDAASQPIAGAIVTYTVPLVGASATRSSATATTNASGKASITVTANTIAGGYTVTANLGALATSFSLTNTAGAPAALAIVSGDGQSPTVGGAFGAPLVAALHDIHGNPITGAQIAFAAPDSGASATLTAPSATDSLGRAAVTATANTIAGGYTITASSDGVASIAFAATNLAGAATSIAIAGGQTQSTVVGTAFATPLAVTIRDTHGNPVAGATVAFAGPGSGAGAAMPASTTSDASGLASVTATANTIAGGYSVTATLAGAPPATFSLANLPGAPASLTVTSGAEQSTVVTAAFAEPLAVVVRDAFGNGVPSATVAFEAPAGEVSASTSSGSAITGTGGVAQITATARTRTGSYAVSASLGALTASFTLTNTHGPAATITAVGGDAQTTTIDTAFAAALVVEVRDEHDNLVPGATVTFQPPASGASANLPATATTDGDGRASALATANQIAGAYVVVAKVASATAQFQLANEPGAPTAIAIAGGDAQATVVDEPLAQPLAVIVRDGSGNPVAGVTVTFAAPDTSAPTTRLAALQATTGTDGRAAIAGTAGTIAGAHQIDASITGATVAFQLANLPGAPAVVRAAMASSPQSATILAPFAALLEVTVEDRFGNACPDATVAFAAPDAPATASLSVASATTDAAGRASTLATASATTGVYFVTASVAGVTDPAAFSLTNLADAPAAIVADSGGGQTAVVATAFTAPLVARVLDAHGNGVPGATVTFHAPQGPLGANLAATAVTTGADGRANVALDASTVSGGYTITATIEGGAAPASFTLTNLPDIAAELVALPSSTPQNATVAKPYLVPLVVVAHDRFGNGVPEATVAFAAPASGATGTLSSSTATTDATGHASVTIVAGITAGAFTITATTPGVTTPATFALANLSGSATAIAVQSGADQHATVATAFAKPLVVVVKDIFGNRVPSATVTFAAPATGHATAQLSSTTVTTDGAGEAAVTATAGTITGAFEVVASTPGGAAPVVFGLTATAGAPTSATAHALSTPQTAQVEHAFAAPLVVVVADEFGNRVPGAGLYVSVPETGASATLSITAPTTNNDGTATVLAVANQIAGSYEVVVSVEGMTTPVVFALTNTPGAPRSLAVVSGAGQHAMATLSFAEPLVVRVQDALGNPIQNAAVDLAMPSSGSSATLAPGSVMTTDAAGRIAVMLVANGHPGAFEVTAKVGGASQPARMAMTIDAIPTTLTLSLPEELPIDDELVASITMTSSILVPAGTVELLDQTGAIAATGTLDATGTLRLPVTPPARGTHAYVARFAAQGAFAASSSTAATIHVLDDTGMLTGGVDGGGCNTGGGRGGATLLGLVLVALFVARRRRSMRAVRAVATLAAIALPLVMAAPAAAQPAGARAIDRLNTASADSDWFALDSVGIGGHREVALSVTGDLAHRPLVVYNADGTPRADVVHDALVLHVGASVSLRDRLRLSATAPLAAYQGGEGGTFNGMELASPDFAFGDVSVAADVRIAGRPGAPFRSAIGVRAALPTGSRTNYMSDGVVGLEGRALVAGTLGRFEYASDVRILVREQTELAGLPFGSELRYGVAAGVRFADNRLLVGPELIGALPIAADSVTGRPCEVGFGAHWRATRALRVGLGASTGVVKAVGTPDARAMLSIAWLP